MGADSAHTTGVQSTEYRRHYLSAKRSLFGRRLCPTLVLRAPMTGTYSFTSVHEVPKTHLIL
jgi:hypothetical protein